MPRSIKWNKQALLQFETAIDYIHQDSPQAAEKVRTAILLKIGSLPVRPEKYNPDKFKLNNDGSFRAFEIYHYRISYRVVKDEIRIIRIRHSKMNPKSF
jgi:plasmid stabilization system protein ParE